MVKSSSKKRVDKNRIGINTIGIDKCDVELTKIGTDKMVLTPRLSATLIPLIHLIAFKLNNSYKWLVS